MLVTFVLFGHWMEMKSRKGTSDSLRALFDIVPPKATVLRDGEELEVPTAEIVVGDRVRLRPGDKVPVDGASCRAARRIDESLVTGESIPVDKGQGDEVVGGSINRAGSVVMRGDQGRRRHRARPDRRAGRAGPELQGPRAAAGGPRRRGAGDPGGGSPA